jgi:hypothetical protein
VCIAVIQPKLGLGGGELKKDPVTERGLRMQAAHHGFIAAAPFAHEQRGAEVGRYALNPIAQMGYGSARTIQEHVDIGVVFSLRGSRESVGAP